MITKIENIRREKNKIEEYCENLINLNEKLDLVITQDEINEVFSFGREV